LANQPLAHHTFRSEKLIARHVGNKIVAADGKMVNSDSAKTMDRKPLSAFDIHLQERNAPNPVFCVNQLKRSGFDAMPRATAHAGGKMMRTVINIQMAVFNLAASILAVAAAAIWLAPRTTVDMTLGAAHWFLPTASLPAIKPTESFQGKFTDANHY